MKSDPPNSPIEKLLSPDKADGSKPDAQAASRSLLAREAMSQGTSAEAEKKNQKKQGSFAANPVLEFAPQGQSSEAEQKNTPDNAAQKLRIESLFRNGNSGLQASESRLAEAIKLWNSDRAERGIAVSDANGKSPSSVNMSKWKGDSALALTNASLYSYDSHKSAEYISHNAATIGNFESYQAADLHTHMLPPPSMSSGTEIVPDPNKGKNISITDIDPRLIPGYNLPSSRPDFPGLTLPFARPDWQIPTLRPELPAPAPRPESPGSTAPALRPEQPGSTAPALRPEQPGSTAPALRPEQPGSTAPSPRPESPVSTSPTSGPESPVSMSPTSGRDLPVISPPPQPEVPVARTKSLSVVNDLPATWMPPVPPDTARIAQIPFTHQIDANFHAPNTNPVDFHSPTINPLDFHAPTVNNLDANFQPTVNPPTIIDHSVNVGPFTGSTQGLPPARGGINDQAPIDTTTSIARGYSSVRYTGPTLEPVAPRPSEPAVSRRASNEQTPSSSEPRQISNWKGSIDSQSPKNENVAPKTQVIETAKSENAKPFSGALANMDRNSLLAWNMPGQSIQSITSFGNVRSLAPLAGRNVSESAVSIIPINPANIRKVDADSTGKLQTQISGLKDSISGAGKLQTQISGLRDNISGAGKLQSGKLVQNQIGAQKDVSSVSGKLVQVQIGAQKDISSVSGKLVQVQIGAQKDISSVSGKLVQNQIGAQKDISSVSGKLVQNQIGAQKDISSVSGKLVQNQIGAQKDISSVSGKLVQIQIAAQKDISSVSGKLVQIQIAGLKDSTPLSSKFVQNQIAGQKDNAAAIRGAAVNESTVRAVGTLVGSRADEGLKTAPRLIDKAVKPSDKITNETGHLSNRHIAENILLAAKTRLQSQSRLKDAEFNSTGFQNVNYEHGADETGEEDSKDSKSLSPALAIAFFMSLSGLARGRQALGEGTLEGVVADDNEPDTTSNQATPLRRRTHLVEAADTLQSIAEKYFSDARIAWLIADLNTVSSLEHEIEERRVVELRARQTIALPDSVEICKFLSDLPRDFDIDQRLVTVVADTVVNEEVLKLCLGLFSMGGTSSESSRTVSIGLPELTIV